MESETLIWTLLGGMFLFVALALSLVTIDKNQLQDSTHSNPGMALFRFGIYRWGAVAVMGVIGLVLLSVSFGWL